MIGYNTVRRFSGQVMVLFCVALLSNCTLHPESGRRFIPRELTPVMTLNLNFPPVKTAWSPYDKSVYIADTGSNEIYIYKGDKQINRVGGLGFGVDNFNRLSDITVTPTGRILALDTYRKEIKQFDAKGMWIDNHKLDFTRQPYLFDVGRDGTVYIYDKGLDEILIIDEHLREVRHRFAKFYFKEPVSIVSNHHHLTVYDRGTDRTYIFDNFGRLESELNGYWQSDRYGNRLNLKINRLISGRDEQVFTLGVQPVSFFKVKDGFIQYVSGNNLTVAEINYQRLAVMQGHDPCLLQLLAALRSRKGAGFIVHWRCVQQTPGCYQ